METDEKKITIFITGATNTGKTGLAYYFIGDPHDPGHQTVVTQIFQSTYKSQNQLVKITYLDTNGLERSFGEIEHHIQSYSIRCSIAIIFIYEIHNTRTFNELDARYRALSPSFPDDCVKILLANSFCPGPREISQEEGKEKAKRFGMEYFETDLQTGEGINDLLDHIVLSTLENEKKETQNQTKPVKDEKPTPPKEGQKKFVLFSKIYSNRL